MPYSHSSHILHSQHVKQKGERSWEICVQSTVKHWKIDGQDREHGHMALPFPPPFPLRFPSPFQRGGGVDWVASHPPLDVQCR